MGPHRAEANGAAYGGAATPRSWWSEDANLQEQIRSAQLQAGRSCVAAPDATTVAPKSFLGNWTDSYGNSVTVRATNPLGLQLVATLSRPPRPDIHLKFRPVETGAGWLCGEATLDATLGPAGSEPTELFWCFPTGDVSVWVRVEEPSGTSTTASDDSPRTFDSLAPLPWNRKASENFDDLQEPWHSTLQAEPYVCVACVPQTVWVAQTVLVPQGMSMVPASPTHNNVN
uniref:Uncharacterized protein n=1 Tax=Alexandrium andersonii TaxID=327968 RepID=A0A7S2MCY3_9DINO